jgi:hypothetical protein
MLFEKPAGPDRQFLVVNRNICGKVTDQSDERHCKNNDIVGQIAGKYAHITFEKSYYQGNKQKHEVIDILEYIDGMAAFRSERHYSTPFSATLL